jgi:hypothetical protein
VVQAVATEIGEVIDYAENQNQRVGKDAAFYGIANRGNDRPRGARCSDQDS